MSFPFFAAFASKPPPGPLDALKNVFVPVTRCVAVALGIEPAYAKDIVLGSLAGPAFQAPKRGMFGTHCADNCAIGGWTVWAA